MKKIIEKQKTLKINNTTISSDVIDTLYAREPKYGMLREQLMGCPQAAHLDFLPNGGAKVLEQ